MSERERREWESERRAERRRRGATAWSRSVSDAIFLYELAQAPTVISGDDRP